MGSKTKILIGVLLIGLLIGGLWLYDNLPQNQIPETYKDQKYCENDIDCILIISQNDCCVGPSIAVNKYYANLNYDGVCNQKCLPPTDFNLKATCINNQCEASKEYFDESDISLITDNTEYVTNGVVFAVISTKVANNLEVPVYFYSGCANHALDTYRFENKTWFKTYSDQEVCDALPRVIELKPKQNTPIKVVISEKGTYRIGFSYSLARKDQWGIGNQTEAFSNQFFVTQIDPTVENSLELCKKAGNFTAVGGSHYSYDYCINRIETWAANEGLTIPIK